MKNMSKIQVMDTHLANMIAAGEVVERPSGIVKELVENALDAHATHIEVRIEEGGMQSIEVIDNGEGMDAEDLYKAFERHSTSKIHHVMDLNRIQTFGFRGEALPSIASVSRVEATTHNGIEGNRILIDNGTVVERTRAARNKGTSIHVMNLFTKVPARLKYIKNVRYETSLLLDIVQKFAVANPGIHFTLTSDGKELFRSYGSGKIEDVFMSVFGSFIAKSALVFSNENYDFKIHGIAAQPQHTRANRYSMWIFINNRMVRIPKIQNAIIEAYRRHIPNDRMPIAFLNITVDPQLVDVNVHPSKWEIRLSKEKELVQLVIETLEQSLKAQTRAPRIRIETPTIEAQETMMDSLLEQKSAPIVETVYDREEVTSPHQEIEEVRTVDYNKVEEKSQIEPLRVLSQMSGKYILAQGSVGLYIIDQHAAMERVRYEYFQNRLLDKETPHQPLLFPLIFDGRQTLIQKEKEVLEAFKSLRISLEVLDETSFVLREHPLWIKEDEITEFINKVLDSFEADKRIDEEQFRNKSIATLACHSSVRFNEYLSHEEMETLVEQLRECNQPYHCPHGRPTFMIIEHAQLWKEFQR